MDERSAQSLQERLDRMEAALGSLQHQVSSMASGLAELEARVVIGTRPKAGQDRAVPPVREVFCRNCLGGNPPSSVLCIWCGAPMLRREAQPAMPPPPPKPSVARPLPPPTPAGLIPSPAPASYMQPAMPGAALAKPVSERVKREVRRLPVPPMPVKFAVAPRIAVARAATVKRAVDVPVTITSEPSTASAVPEAEAPAGGFNFDILGKSEFWLNKAGIILLLLGLVFFFIYSIDKGWLNEPVRVALGLALGTVLLGFGLGMYRTRRHFSQVLLGGSIAIYYITGYAAYPLLHVVDYNVAFGFMTAVTALAFVLAVRQDEAILSLIGVAGGLATPFLLGGEPSGISGLIIYTCIVLTGATAVYMLQGWRSLLWLSYAGAMAVFLIAYVGTVDMGRDTQADRWALQGGILFGVIAFWGVPVLRGFLAHRDPEHWRTVKLAAFVSEFEGEAKAHVHVLAVLVPLITLIFSRATWQDAVDNPKWGWWTLAGAAIYGLVAWALRRDLPKLAYTHALMGILLFTLAVVQIFGGDALFFALALEATALVRVAYMIRDRGALAFGHIIWLGTAAWLALRLTDQLVGQDGLTLSTATDLAVIALLAASSFSVRSRLATFIYRNVFHVSFATWMFAQLLPFPNVATYAMLAWAAYALVLAFALWRWPALFTRADTGYASHLIMAGAAALFGLTIVTGPEGALAVFNWKTLGGLAFVAAAWGMSFLTTPPRLAPAYRAMAHLAALGLLWRELLELQNGEGYVLLSWAIYLAFVQYLARRQSDTQTSQFGTLMFLGTGLVLAARLAGDAVGSPPVFNLASGINLAVIVILAGSAWLVATRDLALGYLLAAHLGFMGWLWHEFHAISPNGEGYVVLAWAAWALVVLYLSHRVSESRQSLWASLLGAATLAGAGIWLAKRLVINDALDPAVLNVAALTDLLVIVSMVGAWYLSRDRRWAVAFLAAAHVVLLAWFWRELSPLPDGNAYISIAWGAYSIVLLVGGLSGRRVMPLVVAGLTTLFLVVAKLFLIDLAAVEMIWRVLLFLGFGGALLMLSYYFQNVIRGKPGPGGSGKGHHFHWPTRMAH